MFYRIKFGGKRTGALGLRSGHVEVVEAADASEARLMLYDQYEHIAIDRIELLGETREEAGL